MPIAHCIVRADVPMGTGDIIAAWSKVSGVGSEHMTVNILRAEQQYGRVYKVMATLYLPSLWSSEKVNDLQVGLADALATHFSITPEEVHVITSIVESGHVVDTGKVERW